MTRTAIAFSVVLALAACNGGGGGHSGATGAPGKSAYEIWLEQGNVGTEQDFLDSLVSGGGSTGGGNQGGNTGGNNRPNDSDVFIPKNKGEEIEHYIEKGLPYYDYNKTSAMFPNGQEYNVYKYSEDGIDSTTGKKYTANYTYNEKELKLGNYIMYMIDREYEDGKIDKILNFEIMNREGKNANGIVPIPGTVFKGNTWAQVSAWGSGDSPEILTGDMAFTYDPLKPELVLAFDNYYQIEFAKTSGYNYNIKISGENSTGKSGFDLPVGEYKNKVPAYGPGGTDAFLKTSIIGKDGTEEAFGEYNASFDHNDFNPNYDVRIHGVFGGTKQ